jgi:uncharacterized membrane protein
MFFDTPAELHAALNDLPAALFFASIVFDWAASASKKDDLKTAAYWCLILGVVGAIGALLSGFSAEGWVEHGGNTHRFIERHETLAIMATVFFGALAGWRIFRANNLPGKERPLYLGLSTVGLALLMWVGHLGGTLVFRQGLGVPSSVMTEALMDRDRGHAHAPGEEHDDTAAAEMPMDGDDPSHEDDEDGEDHEHEAGDADH